MTSRIGLFVLSPAIAWCVQTGGGGPPVVLPPVEVAATAPLVKVAEFRMREARMGAAAVVQGDFIYISGGSNEGNDVMDSIERLDCRTGTSEPFARLKDGRLWHRAVVVGNTMYVLGGETMTRNAAGRLAQVPDDSVELIDLSTRKVSRGVALPEPRRSYGCVLFDGKIYVIGGFVRSGAKAIRTNSTVVFDLMTQRWSPGEPMPTPREAEAALVDGPVIVVPGGYNGVQALANVDLFDPRGGTWRTLPPLCRPASAHSLAFLGHYLFLFGHYDAPEQCLAYDLRTRQSEVLSVPFKGARHSAAVIHQGRIYVIGGRGDESSEAFATVQVFALRKKDPEQITPPRSP